MAAGIRPSGLKHGCRAKRCFSLQQSVVVNTIGCGPCECYSKKPARAETPRCRFCRASQLRKKPRLSCWSTGTAGSAPLPPKLQSAAEVPEALKP